MTLRRPSTLQLRPSSKGGLMAHRTKSQALARLFGTWASAALLGAMLVGGAPVYAQTAAPAAQVLTLDQERLYAESLYGKALEASAIAANQAIAAENRQIEQDLAAEEADLTQKRPTMAASAFQTLADAFDAKVEQVRADQAAKIEAMKTQREEGRKAFFQASVPILADLMRQLGAVAILNRSAVVVVFDSIDVTDRAIAALDAKLGDGTTSGSTGPRLPAATDGVALGTTAPPAP